MDVVGSDDGDSFTLVGTIVFERIDFVRSIVVEEGIVGDDSGNRSDSGVSDDNAGRFASVGTVLFEWVDLVGSVIVEGRVIDGRRDGDFGGFDGGEVSRFFNGDLRERQNESQSEGRNANAAADCCRGRKCNQN